MSAVLARLEGTEEGLSEDELRVATGIVYSRFRGHFTDVTRDAMSDGRADLVVWATRREGPLFRISRWSGRYVAFDDVSGTVHEADGLESLLEALRALYPPMSVL